MVCAHSEIASTNKQESSTNGHSVCTGLRKERHDMPHDIPPVDVTHAQKDNPDTLRVAGQGQPGDLMGGDCSVRKT